MIARRHLSALIVVLACALAACGSDSGSGGGVTGQSAEELLSNAKAQLTQQPTVTVRGAVTDSGSSIKVNLTFSGKTTAGAVVLDGAKLRLLKAKGRVYFKGGDRFYQQAAGANAEQFKATVNGRWILADSKSKDFEDLNGLVDRKKFLGGLAEQLKGDLSKGKESRVAGIECISLRDDSGTLWVNASNGTLVRLETDDGQTLDFRYKRVKPAKPPKPEDVLDLATLG